MARSAIGGTAGGGGVRKAASLSALLLLVSLASPMSAFSVYTKGARSSWPYEREQGLYQVRIVTSGKVLWRVRWETTVKKEQGKTDVEVREEGEGQPWLSKEPLVWQKKLLFQQGPSALQVKSVVGSHWSQDGRPMDEMDYKADPSLSKIFYKTTETGKRPESAVFPWSPQTIPDEMLFHWARTLPFERAAAGERPSADCMLVVSPKQRVRIKAQVKGTEMVTTPAGTFSCYRVELVPQLFGPLKALAPRMTLWCRTDPPNVWVRYQGPVGGAGSPEAVIELVKFTQQGRE